MWIILTVVIVVALMIPIAAILVDSPLGRAWARRFEGDRGTGPGGKSGGELAQLRQQVELLETEVDELHRTLAGVKDEVQFVQRLLENPASRGGKPGSPASGAA
jgi:hypothetical protein